MEARAQYGPWQRERPRLVVVKDGGATGRFSALPHAVLFSDLSDGAVRMYATIQSHAWGDGGECTASHATLATEMGRKERTVRALLRELVDAGFVVERRTGHGQAKAYRTACPDPSGKNLPVESGNILPVVPPKRQKSATQAAKNSQFKQQKSAAPIEEDSGKKTLEEELAPTELGAADAATPATASKQKATSSKKTACPQTFPLEAKHFEYGAGLGLDETRVRAETDKFLAHHRFKGTLGLDWHAGWQNWLRRAVQYDPQPSPQRNGVAAPKPEHGKTRSGAPLQVRRY